MREVLGRRGLTTRCSGLASLAAELGIVRQQGRAHRDGASAEVRSSVTTRLCPHQDAVFTVVEASLYPSTRSLVRARKTVARLEVLLRRQFRVLSVAPFPCEVPLMRADVEIDVHLVGGYPTLQALLELFRPVAQYWHVVPPVPTDSESRWHVWGHAPSTDVPGLHEVFFEANSTRARPLRRPSAPTKRPEGAK